MAQKQLGQILLEMGAIDPLQLRSALAHQQQWGNPLGRTVVELRFCAVSDVMRALSIQTGHPLVDLDSTPLDPAMAKVLPAQAALLLRAVPLRLEGKRQDVMVVAVTAPAPMNVQDELIKASGKKRVIIHLAEDDAVGRAIDELYKGVSRQTPSAEVVMALSPAQTPAEATFDSEESEIVPTLETRLPAFISTPVAPAPTSGAPSRGGNTPFHLPTAQAASSPASASAPRTATAATPQAARPKVRLLGWNSARERALTDILRIGGLDAQPLSDAEVDLLPAHEVLLVSTLGVQAYFPAGQKIANTKVIVLGQPQDADIEDARTLGARIYLRPPFSPEKLCQAILKLH